MKTQPLLERDIINKDAIKPRDFPVISDDLTGEIIIREPKGTQMLTISYKFNNGQIQSVDLKTD